MTNLSPRPARGQRPIPVGSPADVHAAELARARFRLDRLREHHPDLVRRFLSVADGALYTLDLVFGAVMTRSYSLVHGFLDAFDQWNPMGLRRYCGSDRQPRPDVLHRPRADW